jgi:tetratricopeptide (TPR) repeat protein
MLGLIAARTAAGEAGPAIEELDRILDGSPLWIEGHFQLAQLRTLTGDASAAAASLERAIARQPRDPNLWLALCDLHLRREDYGQLRETIARAAAAGIPAATLQVHNAVAAGELGEAQADELQSDAAATANPHLMLWRVRHLLRQGRAAEALPLIDRELESERRPAIWPYAAAAWRLTGDARSAWLEDQPGLVSVTDIASNLGPIAPLVERLRALHARSGQYLDQSVRGGSQTDGPLLSRIEPEIRRLRSAIVAAVQGYVEQLPPPDPAHPLLGQRRDRRIRFAGSWSVRLRSGGRHSNHVHPQGWISSALYLDLPDIGPAEPSDAGWLLLGEPDAALGLDLPAHSKVEPRVGQLVLFPSWMWHGTRPFAEGERLTVAFDVAPPK